MSTDMQKRAGPWLRMALGGWYRSGGKGFDAAVITNTERGKLAHIWRGDDKDLEEVFCGPVDASSHAAKEAADKALLEDGWLLDLSGSRGQESFELPEGFKFVVGATTVDRLVRFACADIPGMVVYDEDIEHELRQAALTVCAGLNELARHPDIAADILAVISARTEPTSATAKHPYINLSPGGKVGFLGILNGALGGAARIEALVNRATTTFTVLEGASSDPNPILCEHANEVPAQCGCPPDCYCKSHTCRPIVNSLGEQIGTMGAPLGEEVP